MIFSAFCNRWTLRFPAWLLQDLFNNKYVCSHICFNQHSRMLLLRQTFPLCCLLKCIKFWHVWFCYTDSVCVCVCVCVCVKVAQSCPTLCEPLDCSLPGSSAHGIPQARKNTRAANCSLLQRIFLTQGSPLRVDSLIFEPPGKPIGSINPEQKRKKKLSVYLQRRRLSSEMLWDFSFFSNRFLKLSVYSFV